MLDPKLLMQALLMVHKDKRPKTDAVFIHGSSIRSDVLDDAILKLGKEICFDGGQLVINGLSDETCTSRVLAYPGAGNWERKLAAIGISNVLKIEPAFHTAAESEAVIDMTVKNGWKSITIVAFPTHILRCLLQMIFCINRRNENGEKVNLAVYTRTLETMDWNMPAMKPILGGGVEGGVLSDHIVMEFDRIVKYMDKDSKGKYTPHATLEELMDYLRQRDKVAVSA